MLGSELAVANALGGIRKHCMCYFRRNLLHAPDANKTILTMLQMILRVDKCCGVLMTELITFLRLLSSRVLVFEMFLSFFRWRRSAKYLQHTVILQPWFEIKPCKFTLQAFSRATRSPKHKVLDQILWFSFWWVQPCSLERHLPLVPRSACGWCWAQFLKFAEERNETSSFGSRRWGDD